MTPKVGTLRRRRTGTALLAMGLIAWGFAAIQPCCEALAAAAPHDHPTERHSPSLHYQSFGETDSVGAGDTHSYCAPHALAAVDSSYGFAASAGPRAKEAKDGGDLVQPGEAWPIAAVAYHLAPPGLPPPGDPGARTYLRFQRFLE